MAKLRLKLEELCVESFATLPGSGARGTVHGMDRYSEPGQTCADSCDECHPRYETEGCASADDYSCVDTCAYTCGVCNPTWGGNEIGTCIAPCT